MREQALPQGMLPMRGEGFNGTSTREEVALTTQRMNTQAELEGRFFGDNPYTVLKLPLNNGSEIRAHKASGPYTPHHLMIIAHGPDFMTLPRDKTVKTETIYGYPKDTQVAYWSVLLNSIQAYKDVLGPDYRVFSGGNWAKTFSNFDERNPRSIGLPHDHICAVREEDLTGYAGKGLTGIEGFTTETAITKRLLPTVLPRIQNMLPKDSPLRLSPRTELPYGYSFTIDPSSGVEEFAQQMREHHEAYANVASSLQTRFSSLSPQGTEVLSQPSYKLYIELGDKGEKHVSISPLFAGPVGVLESAGIQSQRHPAFHHLVPPEDADEVRRTVVGKVKANLDFPVRNLVRTR